MMRVFSDEIRRRIDEKFASIILLSIKTCSSPAKNKIGLEIDLIFICVNAKKKQKHSKNVVVVNTFWSALL